MVVGIQKLMLQAAAVVQAVIFNPTLEFLDPLQFLLVPAAQVAPTTLQLRVHHEVAPEEILHSGL